MKIFDLSPELELQIQDRLLPADDCEAIYNGLDTIATFEIMETLESEMAPDQRAVYEFEKELQAPALEMMLRGLRIDSGRKLKKISEYEEKIQRVAWSLDELRKAVEYPSPINPQSPPQLQDFFYGHLRVPEIQLGFKGQRRITTNREALEKMRSYAWAIPFVNHILKLRDLKVILAMLRTGVDQDSRLRTSYGVAGTETGRWSSRRNVFGTGGNLQNQHPTVKEIIVADPGYKFVYVDLEQAESRAVGWICYRLFGAHAYLDACESGDLHTTVATMCFPKIHSREDAEQPFYRHFTYRDGCKRLGHGSNYLGTPWTMSRHTKYPVPVIQDFQNRYFGPEGAFPEIKEWHRWVAAQIQTNSELTTYMGRRRQFYGRTGDEATIREAVAFEPQSAVADTLNQAMLRLWTFSKHMGWQLLAQIHDAILMQVPDDQNFNNRVSDIVTLIENYQMDLNGNPIEHNGRRLRIPCEPKVGWRWCPVQTKREDEPSDPDGLLKWKKDSPDTRRRVFVPSNNLLEAYV